ncbi:unnamed protein product [Cuscuta campestris]|uniref:Uncharacterized protein n=1 Tax=Cuscuta campestris TaxID=132261 RepID=A0A484LE79_9ASTE|nr:unnamed protein product [Cuscuta campestris]
MGVQLLDIEVQAKKVLIFSIKTCYETASNHPSLVGFLCFLAFLHRSFPLVFSVLVSVSPVLICTAILLGTLLSFGHPNQPQVEREGDEKTVHGIIPLRTGVLPSTTVVEREEEERYRCVDRHTNTSNGNEKLERSLGNVGKESRGVELFDGGILERGYPPIPNMDDENLDFDDERPGGSFGSYMDYQNLDFDKKSVDSFDSKMVNIGSPLVNREILEPHQYSRVPNVDDDENLEFDSDSRLARVDWNQDGEEEEDVGDTASDSGSDGAESSSPDASMADIIPMLSELHPLLDEEESNNNPHHDNDSESDDGTENREGEAEAKEKSSDKEEETEGAAIVWTEEDEKNLMDLGSSEIERNQRLESLIARRRARKDRRTTIERNLIDFESVLDLSFNISPISTSRKNPFDVPVDDLYGIGLPPIPGSAPSVLLPRSNPFDIPYDSSEEKPDLMEDSFQQEFKTFHAKDPFFRRHESFNVRPSSFGPSKQGTGLEGASYSRFQRQSSELSDSKISSVPETDSTGSATDLEAKNLGDEIEMSWKSEEHCYELGPSPVHEECVAKDLDPSATKNHSNPESFEISLGGAGVDENQYREPVYDLSPVRAKEIFSSSFASGVQVERIQEKEKSTPITEETLSALPLSQPVVVEKELISNLDIKGHTESQEPPVILMESSKETGEPNVSGIKDVDSEAQLNTVTPQSPAFAAILLRTADGRQSDIIESSFNEPQDDDLIDAPIPHMFLMEAIDFHEKMQHVVEETDGIKEIDEGILSELDAVGDFSVKEPVLRSFNEFEGISILHNIGPFTPRFHEEEEEEDQDSIRDHEKTFAVLGTSQLNQNSSTEDIKSGIPVVGEKSLKDLDILSEQSKLNSMENKEVLEGSELLQDVLLEEDADSGQNIQEDEKYDLLDHHSHADSGTPIHEAHSIEAIDSQFKQIDSIEHESPKLLDPSTHANDEKAAGKSGISVHEAQSTQDIDSSFKQTNKKEDEKCDLGDPSTHANNENAPVESQSSKNAIPQHEHSMLLDSHTHFKESTMKEDVEDKSENPLKSIPQDESNIQGDPTRPMVYQL